MCCLYQIEIGALARGLHDFSESYFVVSALCWKCTKHLGRNNDIVQ